MYQSINLSNNYNKNIKGYFQLKVLMQKNLTQNNFQQAKINSILKKKCYEKNNFLLLNLNPRNIIKQKIFKNY